MNMILPNGERLPAHPWRWRDRTGQFHRPQDMETRHLFYTLRMIWNNFMPPEMRVGAVKLYDFGPSYTKPYLADAIEHLYRELEKRTDMTQQWSDELNAMKQWFANGDAPVMLGVARSPTGRRPREPEMQSLPYKPQLGDLT